VRWDATGHVAELQVITSAPSAFIGHFAGNAPVIVDVNGRPGYSLTMGSVASATGVAVVVWSPSPGVVAQFGIVGTVDQAITIARSMRAVDQATWERSTTKRPPSTSDGCDSLFC
jgi:hypothetical protein